MTSTTKPRLEVNYEGKTTVTMYNTEVCDDVAVLASVLVEKWALVAAAPDGEDSAGRAKMRLLTPDELVERSVLIAERFFETMRARGYLVAVPDLNEVNVEYDAKAKAKAAREEHDAKTRLARAEYEAKTRLEVARAMTGDS